MHLSNHFTFLEIKMLLWLFLLLPFCSVNTSNCIFVFRSGGDPSHDVCCPNIWPSPDWWKRGRHFPAQDQVGGWGPQGAASRHVSPRELQAQPNKPRHTNSGCTHLMNITVTAVDVLLYWLSRGKKRIFGEWFGCALDICEGGSAKRFSSDDETCF